MLEICLAIGMTALCSIAFWRRRAGRVRFLSRSKPTEKFVGKDITFALSELGSYTFFGSMDFGEEVAQWESHGVVVELWFKNGLCVTAKVI